MGRIMRGKRRASVLLGVALTALAFGVSVGLAKSGPGQVKVNLYTIGTVPWSICPVPTGKHAHGKATVSREKGVITVRVHLHDAVPGKYVLQLLVPWFRSAIVGCTLYGPASIDTFGVDSSGDGQGGGSFVGTTNQTFAVFASNVSVSFPIGNYISPFFKLGSS
jgi:hypothetical protein